jgi:hypothetical protein
MTAPIEIATWMKSQIPENAMLRQAMVAWQIKCDFGQEFTYLNKQGNLAIRADILKEFRRITEGTIVWSRSQQAWRNRREGDPEGRLVL